MQKRAITTRKKSLNIMILKLTLRLIKQLRWHLVIRRQTRRVQATSKIMVKEKQLKEKDRMMFLDNQRVTKRKSTIH